MNSERGVSQNVTNEVEIESRISFDLCTATSVGDVEWVRQMFPIRAYVNTSNKSGWTPTMYSAYYGHHQILELLVQNGAEVNSMNNCGQTALMLAAKCGNIICCDVLLRNAAAIDAIDSYFHTALTYAICARYDDLTSFLVKHGADVNIRLGREETTPIMFAADIGNEEIIKILLEAGAKCDFKSFNSKLTKQFGKEKPYVQSDCQGPVLNPPNKKSEGKSYYDVCSPQPVNPTNNSLHFDVSFPADLASLLTSLSLYDYITLFESHNVNLQDFLQLTSEDLKKLGVDKLGPRSKMSKAILRLNSRFPQINSPVHKVAANKQQLEIESLKEKLALCEVQLIRERLKTLDLKDNGETNNMRIIQEAMLPLFNLDWQSETLKQTARALREQLWQEQSSLGHGLLCQLYDKVQDIEKLTTDMHAQILMFLKTLKDIQ